MITPDSRLTFGKYFGKKLSDCPKSYLQWLAANLLDTDFHLWAIIAQEILDTREAEDAPIEDLEQQADDFLRQAGYDPRKL